MASPGGARYSRAEFKLKLEIGSVTFNDVVGISATFGVNAIPTAVIQLAAGKSIVGGKDATLSSAARTLAQIKPREKAKVTLTVKNNSSSVVLKDKEIPDGDHIIFEGYYGGFGHQRSLSTAAFTIHLVHWIDDLNCSSVLNGNWFQGAPYDLAQAAVPFQLREDGGSGNAIRHVPGVDKELFDVSKVSTDFWEKTLKPMFIGLANMPHPSVQTGDADAGGVGGASNKAAQDALARMPGSAPVKSKLALGAIADLDDSILLTMFQNGLGAMLTSAMSHTSFWSKLVGELGASFLFGVSPGVEFANVFPYFAGLRKPWRTIKTDDYNFANFSSSAATLIESIDIFYTSRSTSNYEIGGRPGPPPISTYRPLGSFPKTNKNLRGQIIIREPPPWMAIYAPLAQPAAESALDVRQDATTGNVDPTEASTPTATEATENVKAVGILDKYAQHWYQTAVLSQRTGEISGRLRFDIAPGSIVAIETEKATPPTYTPATYSGPGSGATRSSASRQTPGTTVADTTLYAMVTHVSFVINAEQHTAGTSLSLMSVRHKAENESDTYNLTADAPPLYPESAWSGGPLIRGISA